MPEDGQRSSGRVRISFDIGQLSGLQMYEYFSGYPKNNLAIKLGRNLQALAPHCTEVQLVLSVTPNLPATTIIPAKIP